MAKELLESGETEVPQALVGAEPLVGFGERLGIQTGVVNAAAHSARYQAGTLEHLDVLGRRREGQRKRLGQLADRMLAASEALEHGATGGLAQGAEYLIEARRIFN